MCKKSVTFQTFIKTLALLLTFLEFSVYIRASKGLTSARPSSYSSNHLFSTRSDAYSFKNVFIEVAIDLNALVLDRYSVLANM